MDDGTRLEQVAADWSPDNRKAMLDYWSSEARREQIKKAYTDAADLAKALDPRYVVTPALKLIATSIETVLQKPRRNLLVTMPPQEGKSFLCAVYTPLRALMLNPNCRIILATYGDALAVEHSQVCRERIEQHGSGVVDQLTGTVMEDKLGYRLAVGQNKIGMWKIAGARGGMIAVGLGASVTGRPADLLIIDDPFKNMMEADSVNHRRKVLDWFNSVGQTRLSPEASIILIQCMTGDTPVLMADGSERELRQIRVGDKIATYENGHLSTSTVRNWANQGPDTVFAVRVKSGRVVQANARHPFLISEGGREVWRRTDQLKPGDLLIGTASGSGRALSTDATNSPTVRACACPTTTKCGGPTDTAELPPSSTATATSSIGMGSVSRSTAPALKNRAAFAHAAVTRRRKPIALPTGRESSASTMTTTPGRFGAFSAMTATSPSGGRAPLPDSAPPPTISTDEVVSVEPAGTAEVFDLQVDRTENFIANGLVSHNTRWHPEDLAGQIIADTVVATARFKTWRHINIPAVSEEGIPDALNREPGTPMESARGRTAHDFEATRRAVGERTWYALYQGSPRNPAGGLFARAWFEPPADEPDNPVAAVVGIDPADTGENDDTGIIAAVLAQDGTIVLTEDWSGQFTSDVWARRAVTLALTIGAREIAMEAYSTAVTYEQVIKRAYRAIHTDAITKHRAGVELTSIEMRALGEYPPFTIYKWRAGAKVDAVGRSALLRQALETRKARVVEHKLATFVDEAADWQAGQHQPDRVAAAIIAHDRLAALGSGRMTLATPVDERPDPVERLRAIGSNAPPSRLARRLGH